SRIIAFEPMRLQHAILSINVLLNELQGKVEVHKLALSDRTEFSRMITPNSHNIGRSMIASGVYGEWVKLVRGDDLLSAAQVDFLKIDVEGHEMEALAGLAKTIDRCRPAMLIEVSDCNGADFESWLMDNGYSISRRMRHHGENTEVLALPN
ncbi:FkbM family methyltransferase, partial [Alcanivorax sp. 1008]|uniref:FkbM family methyltransferase n=1 Tax=Alcanivorax sp. 1008 TaxID=2816853 RepID=UPI001D2BA29E